jgi:hypothetical protein
MRASEFITETASIGASSAGSMATISQSLGGPIRRANPPKPAKYSNSVNSLQKRKKHDARG